MTLRYIVMLCYVVIAMTSRKLAIYTDQIRSIFPNALVDHIGV